MILIDDDFLSQGIEMAVVVIASSVIVLTEMCSASCATAVDNGFGYPFTLIF